LPRTNSCTRQPRAIDTQPNTWRGLQIMLVIHQLPIISFLFGTIFFPTHRSQLCCVSFNVHMYINVYIRFEMLFLCFHLISSVGDILLEYWRWSVLALIYLDDYKRLWNLLLINSR
jgi:hypothetical protein